jgi:hypothetical protein
MGKVNKENAWTPSSINNNFYFAVRVFLRKKEREPIVFQLKNHSRYCFKISPSYFILPHIIFVAVDSISIIKYPKPRVI